MRSFALSAILGWLLAGAPLDAAESVPKPTVDWPRVNSPVGIDPAHERRIDALLSAMSIEQKVGQLIQPDIAFVTPDEVGQYHIGTVLTGGNSSPKGNDVGPAHEWLDLADRFWEASTRAVPGNLRIPVLWGTDAVHGHSNVVGATLFPHNIGLGAANDPDLIRRIGEVTATEMVVTGFDWNFSPTLATVRDDRWGRGYEGFSEDPRIVVRLAGPMVEGLQGKPGTVGFLGAGKVLATVKHWLGDGGTTGGRDQGDTAASEIQLRDIHAPAYFSAIGAGAQAVMASFSSVNGTKVSGDRHLVDTILKKAVGFDGIVVSDWNAHAQVPGCSNTSCARSVNAGLDVLMAPDSWKGLYASTVAQARSGEIPPARIDDAVRRILRVKLRYGLFDKGKPSSRPLAGRFDLLGAPAHRAIAREAVRKSLVLLKNEGVLPLAPRAHILVAGAGADSIPAQAGGWSLSWQGTGTSNADFPNAETIWGGIEATVRAGGGTATLATDGRFTTKPDAAIVVFGEAPYAEFVGDKPTLEYSPGDKRDLELLRRLKAAGVPVVTVFLSGRPMWVNPELNASDAFVAAFLPGTEGGGIADVLFRKPDGGVAHDFQGRLSFSWPRRLDQTPLNIGDTPYDPLFAYGYGLDYRRPTRLPQLSEDRPAGPPPSDPRRIFVDGRLQEGWTLSVVDDGGARVPITGNAGRSASGRLSVTAIDRARQEDARRLAWNGTGAASVRIAAPAPLDLTRDANAELSVVLDIRVDSRPAGPVNLAMDGGAVPIGAQLRIGPPGVWRTLAIPIVCFARAGADLAKVTAPFELTSVGALTLSIADIKLAIAAVPPGVCP